MAGWSGQTYQAIDLCPRWLLFDIFAMTTIESLNLSRLYTVHPRCPTTLPSGTHLWLPTSMAAFPSPFPWTHLLRQDETELIFPLQWSKTCQVFIKTGRRDWRRRQSFSLYSLHGAVDVSSLFSSLTLQIKQVLTLACICYVTRIFPHIANNTYDFRQIKLGINII